jgi:general secretion pathway protein D
VELTPHIHGTDEVSMHIIVDISNVASTVNLGGLQQPVIAQKKNEADIRIRDGEVSLIGGLIQNQDSTSIAGIPGLANIPIVGKYFLANTNKEKDRTNLLIAMIPHIVRTPDVTALDLRGVAAGTDQTVKLNYAPKKDESAAAPATAPASAPQAAPAPTPVVPAPAVPSPGGSARLNFVPNTAQVALSAPLTVTIQGDNFTDLFGAPIRLKWDPKLLRLNQVTPGALLSSDGQKLNPPTLDIRNDSGEASIDISRVTGAGGVDGSGPLVQLIFMAIGKGTGTVAVSEANLRDSKQQPITVTMPSLLYAVQ